MASNSIRLSLYFHLLFFAISMKILIAHNRYIESGGEDEVVRMEIDMLKRHGHEVLFDSYSNEEFMRMSPLAKFRFLLKDIYWRSKIYYEFRKQIERESPNIVHVHNIFFMITPSVYDACYDAGVPVVQTLHNYRFFCINGLFFRRSSPCEECLRYGIKHSVINRCWRNSFLSSCVAAGILYSYRKRSIFRKISSFIVLSRFSKMKFSYAGIPTRKLYIKPNYVVHDKSICRDQIEDYAVVVGRLADYKGIRTVIDAFKICDRYKLRIIGSGPLVDYVKYQATFMRNVEYIGQVSFNEVVEYLSKSVCLIAASSCYETFGRTVIEAYALGVPVVVSAGGALEELVVPGKTGYIFERDNSNQLAERISILFEQRDLVKRMGDNARKVYEQYYTEEENYNRLMDIYNQTISSWHGKK